MLWLRAGGVCFIITKLPAGEPAVLQQASSRTERTQECVAVACLKHLFISLVFTRHSFTCMEQLVAFNNAQCREAQQNQARNPWQKCYFKSHGITKSLCFCTRSTGSVSSAVFLKNIYLKAGKRSPKSS